MTSKTARFDGEKPKVLCGKDPSSQSKRNLLYARPPVTRDIILVEVDKLSFGVIGDMEDPLPDVVPSAESVVAE